MRVHPLCNEVLDVQDGEWKPVLEDEQWHVIDQMPFVLAECSEFVLGHHLGLFDPTVVQDEFFCFFHSVSVLIDAYVLEVPV
jgi:hypothetical protein